MCGAVFIAAGMIAENWLKVALTAMALGIGLYIIPLAMVAHPALLHLTSNPVSALLAFIQTAVGLGLLSHGMIAKLPTGMRPLFIGACLFIVFVTV